MGRAHRRLLEVVGTSLGIELIRKNGSKAKVEFRQAPKHPQSMNLKKDQFQ
jgi:hypothetical protein